jgi:hypothetical protein
MRSRFFCAYDEMVAIDDLEPHPDNPNEHPKRQVEVIANLIREVGWRAPITVSRLSGYIVRGHGRLMAAMHLGLTEVPVNFQDYKNPTEEIVDLVADNQVPEFSKMREKDLAILLKKTEQEGADLSLLGFSDKQIQKMFDSLIKGPDLGPEVPFTMELHETSQYVVLVFNNAVDWLQAQTLFDLRTVKALDSKPGFEKKGIGRVIDGPTAIKKITG